jgi:hypothetical protein
VLEDDFAGTGPRVVASDGHNDSGISPPTVSWPFAPASFINASRRAPSLVSSCAVPRAGIAMIAANREHDKNRSDAFIVASGDNHFPHVRLVSVAKLVDFERRWVSYADFISITV